jgi:hypothetical protein
MAEEDRVPLPAVVARNMGEVAPRIDNALTQSERTADHDDRDEDTIELLLTPERALALSRAAEEQQAGAFLDALPAASSPDQIACTAHRGAIRFGGWSLPLAALVLGIAIGIALGPATHLLPHGQMATIAAPSSAPPSPEPRELPVQFSNPFDQAEVFEFPPGTSADEARQSVAARLLQRAHDRQVAGVINSRRPMPRTAHGTRLARNSQSRSTQQD